MIRIWVVFLVVMATACPAAAQTRVRLEVEAESWLEPTPFDALREFTAKLSEAGVEIVDTPDVPVVHLLYEETAGPGYSPRLVPSTRIHFTISVDGPTGAMFQKSRSGIGFPLRPPKNFPSAAELRMLAIAEFRQYQDFNLVGHIVGAVLGRESSFRPLLAAKEPDWLYARMLIEKVSWSPSNDDMFVRAFRVIPLRDKMHLEVAEAFLQKNLTAIQGAAADTSAVSPLLAILVLEDYGEASATQTLKDLASHPRFGAPAVRALKAIQSR